MTSAADPPVRYAPTLVIGLLGVVAVTVGVAKPWATATAQQTGLPNVEAQVTGADLAPLAGALGVVVLAAFGAVIATRGWVRRWLGLIIVVAAAVVLVTAIHPPGAEDALRDGLDAKGWTGEPMQTSTAAWRWLALLGSVLAMAAGAAIFVFGSRWATMGTAYDAPTAPSGTDGAGERDGTAPVLTEADVWREIDHGRDPTRRHDG